MITNLFSIIMIIIVIHWTEGKTTTSCELHLLLIHAIPDDSHQQGFSERCSVADEKLPNKVGVVCCSWLDLIKFRDDELQFSQTEDESVVSKTSNQEINHSIVIAT